MKIKTKGDILIIDDDQTIADFEKEILDSEGYSVFLLAEKTLNTERISEHINNYDLIIIDQIMPKIKGTDLAKKIHVANGNLPVILCSGDLNAISHSEIKNAHLKGLLNKPFTPNELVYLVSRVLA